VLLVYGVFRKRGGVFCRSKCVSGNSSLFFEVGRTVNGDLRLDYKKLPRNRKTERCFYINGKPMPICVRCVSILMGYTSIPFILLVHIPFWVGILCQIPMIIDGYTQLLNWRTSNNILRLITGLVSGVGLSIGIISMDNFLVDL
jgi:uncharacterized membrane protein